MTTPVIRSDQDDVDESVQGRGGSARDWARLIVATSARVVLYTLLGLLLWAAVPAVWGWQPSTVMTGSMMPRIIAGDVVVAMPVPATELKPGRVLLVQDPDRADHLRLHRYLAMDPSGMLQLKGDANPQPDSSLVSTSDVHGVAILRVPYVGLPIIWMQERRLLPIVLGIASLGVLLAAGTLDRRLRVGAADEVSAEQSHGRRFRRPGVAVGAGLGLLLSVALVLFGGTEARFTAQAPNATSSLGAAAVFDCLKRTPTPTGTATMFLSYNEASGTALDSSGSSRTGALVGGATRSTGTCASGNSPVLNLDGTSGQVVTTGPIAAPQVFTVETWFKTSTARGGKLIGFGNSQSGSSGSFDRHLYLNNAGRIVFGVYNSGYKTVTSANSYNDNAWHLATATVSSSTITLYIDGTSVGTLANSAAETNTGYWRIGYDNLSGWPTAPTSNYFTGSLDNTAVYSSALTAAQVREHVAAGR